MSFLYYLTKNYSYSELLLLQYLFKKQSVLKIIITTLVKQAYTDFLVLRIILINPVFIIIIIQKIYKFRIGLEYNSILNQTGIFFYNNSSGYNSKTTIPCKLYKNSNSNNNNNIIPE